MCGLFGIFGPDIQGVDLTLLKELCFVSALRGGDGTGVVQGKQEKKKWSYIVEKGAWESPYFLWFHSKSKDGNNDVLDDYSCNFFLGHTRYATRGEVKASNCHPFDIQSVVGTHNGTLKDRKYQHKDKTDSELMFTDIAKNGLIPVLTDLNEDSAYAIAMFDKAAGEVVLTKNSKRPLVYAVHKNRNVVYYASERAMLEFCAVRNNVDIGTIYRLTDNVVYRCDPSKKFTLSLTPWESTKSFIPSYTKKVFTVPERTDATPPIQVGFVPDKTPTTIGRTISDIVFGRPSGPHTPVIRNQQNQEPRKPLVSLPAPRKTLNLNNRSKEKSAKGLITECVFCSMKMDLYEQYKGVQIDLNTYCCRKCDEISSSMLKTSEGTVH